MIDGCWTVFVGWINALDLVLFNLLSSFLIPLIIIPLTLLFTCYLLFIPYPVCLPGISATSVPSLTFISLIVCIYGSPCSNILNVSQHSSFHRQSTLSCYNFGCGALDITICLPHVPYFEHYRTALLRPSRHQPSWSFIKIWDTRWSGVSKKWIPEMPTGIG